MIFFPSSFFDQEGGLPIVEWSTNSWIDGYDQETNWNLHRRWFKIVSLNFHLWKTYTRSVRNIQFWKPITDNYFDDVWEGVHLLFFEQLDNLWNAQFSFLEMIMVIEKLNDMYLYQPHSLIIWINGSYGLLSWGTRYNFNFFLTSWFSICTFIKHHHHHLWNHGSSPSNHGEWQATLSQISIRAMAFLSCAPRGDKTFWATEILSTPSRALRPSFYPWGPLLG